MDKTYNGHKNWTHWNVSLWLGNDEGLYRMALDAIEQGKAKASRLRAKGRSADAMRIAAHTLQNDLPAKTPDGAKYSVVALVAALRGLCE